jgi:hypothetical protein
LLIFYIGGRDCDEYFIEQRWNLGNFLQRNPIIFRPNNNDDNQNVNQNAADARPAAAVPHVVRNPLVRPRAAVHLQDDDEASMCLREVFVGLFIGFFFSIFGLIIM